MPVQQDNQMDQGPVGQGNYIVREGECMESIALKHGFFWETLWNHPNNAEIREKREDAQCLLPGDRVFVPEMEPKQESVANEQRHRFTRKGVPSYLEIYVKQYGEALGDMPYLANIDGDVRKGMTDEKGLVKEPIPPNAKRCKLTVGEGEDAMVLELELGGLDPITEVSGVQKRLDNLGYKCAVTGVMDDQTREAIIAFQKQQAMEESGKIDNETREAIKQLHMS